MTQFARDLAVNPFLLSGLMAGLLASFACGMIGPYVITRRIVFLTGAIAHMAVGGIGSAIYLRSTMPGVFGWLSPIMGALAAAIASAVVIGLVHGRVRERMDTLIGAMWAVGMSIGILLIKLTQGYEVELMSYLFGNIAIVPWSDVWLMAGLVAVIAGVLLTCHKQLLAICLDDEHADVQGVNVLAMNIVLLALVGLTVICLIQVVGLILVLALLTLPAATAGHHVGRLASMCWVATLLCASLTTVPRIAVYGLEIGGRSVSPESAIVLSAGLVYLASVLVRHWRGA